MPTEDAGQAYANELGLSGFPVTADVSYQVDTKTPWSDAGLPNKCALAPDMTMLACYIGDDDTEGFEAIQAHAAAN